MTTARTNADMLSRTRPLPPPCGPMDPSYGRDRTPSPVARIDLDHNVVVDCPEPSRRAFEGFREKMTEEEEREAMVLDKAATNALWQANSTKSALYALACKSVDAKQSM